MLFLLYTFKYIFMKTNKTTCIATFIFLCFAIACIKTGPTMPNCGELPCPTTTGKNIVSCYVNGKPYIAQGGYPKLGMFSGCVEGCYLDEPNIELTFRFCDGGKYAEQINIFLGTDLHLGEYKLDSKNKVDFDMVFFRAVTNDLNIGTVNITNLTDSSVSGNFDFYASADSSVNQYHITQGNFDISR
jgi:hypothetical protein